MSFSRLSQPALEAFAAHLGLPLRPAADGSVSFAFARSGTLSLTPSRDGGRILMSLARDGLHLDEARERRLLGLSGFDAAFDRAVHVGITRGGSVVFALALDDEEVSLPVLDACLRHLMDLHGTAR